MARNSEQEMCLRFEHIIAEVKEDIAKSRNVSAYDYSSPETFRRIEKQIEEKYRYDRKGMKRIKSSGNSSLSLFDYDGDILKRRTESLLEYLPKYSERYKEKYPLVSVEDELISYISHISFSTIDRIDCESYITLAAAIWILDNIDETYKKEYLLNILPEEKDLEDIIIPGLTDYIHTRREILGVMDIINRRNDDNEPQGKTFINRASAKRKSAETTVPDLLKCDDKDISDFSNRQRFDALLSLLNTKDIERAIDRYRNLVWDFSDNLFKGYNIFAEEEKNLTDESEKIVREAEIKFDRYKASRANVSAPPILLMPKSQNKSPLDLSDFEKDDSKEQLLKIMLKLDSHIYKVEQLQDDRLAFTLDLNDSKRYVHNELTELFDDKLIDILEYNPVKDPYEVCFAFLYLLDKGDNLAWLYNINTGLLLCAADLLPWNCHEFDNRDFVDENNPEYEHTDADDEEQDKEIICDEQTDLRYIDIGDHIDEIASAYEKKYSDAYLWNSPEDVDTGSFHKLNISQIFYERTHTVLPRRLFDYSNDLQPFDKTGITEDEVKKLELAFNLGERTSAKSFFTRYYVKGIEEKEPVPEVAEEEINTVEDISDIDLENYKDQIRKLKVQIVELHNSVNSEKKKNETLKRENDEKNSELAELRSMIVKTDGDSKPVEIKTEVELPYTVNHRTVVFGGHDSWSRSIKHMLNNIRFIDATMRPNTSLILNAEVVWIQNNAISHSDYYKILDLVRTHGITLKYFSYASAEKCAEQLALEDMNGYSD